MKCPVVLTKLISCRHEKEQILPFSLALLTTLKKNLEPLKRRELSPLCKCMILQQYKHLRVYSQAERQVEAAIFLVDKIILFLMGSHTWWAKLCERVHYPVTEKNAVPLSLPVSSSAPPRLALLSLAPLVIDRVLLAHSNIQRGMDC